MMFLLLLLLLLLLMIMMLSWPRLTLKQLLTCCSIPKRLFPQFQCLNKIPYNRGRNGEPACCGAGCSGGSLKLTWLTCLYALMWYSLTTTKLTAEAGSHMRLTQRNNHANISELLDNLLRGYDNSIRPDFGGKFEKQYSFHKTTPPTPKKNKRKTAHQTPIPTKNSRKRT